MDPGKPTDSTAPEVALLDNPSQLRYEVHVDGALAGSSRYRTRPGLIAFLHTEIDREFEGLGLAGRLIAFALDDARRRGFAVRPFCPFVNDYIKRHPQYLDLVPERDRKRFGLS